MSMIRLTVQGLKFEFQSLGAHALGSGQLQDILRRPYSQVKNKAMHL